MNITKIKNKQKNKTARLYFINGLASINPKKN